MRNGTRAARANDRGAEVDLAAVRHRHDDPAVDHLENDLHPDRALLPDLEVVDLLRTSRMEALTVTVHDQEVATVAADPALDNIDAAQPA